MIQIKHLSVKGKLTDLNLEVQPGELVAVVGSRGSGKTTLVRALVGQYPVHTGSALVDLVPMGAPAGLALCGVAGEAWALMDRITAWESLVTFAQFWGVPEPHVTHLLQRVELGGRLRTRVDRLTAGEAARLRLARALIHNPKALLLDEPAGDIDSESASLIAFTIAEEAEAGKAVLVTTFGDPRILQLASRLCYLEGGRLVEPPSPSNSPGPSESAAVPAPAHTSGASAADSATPRTPASIHLPTTTVSGPLPTPAHEPRLTTPSTPSLAAAPAPEPPPLVPADRLVPHVAARKGDRVLLFRPDEIRLAYAREKAVYIETPEGSCGVSFTLTELEERLAQSGFFRSHKAYLVNLAYVKEIASWTRDSFSLILKDGTEVPLSKHRAQELRVRLNW